MGTARKATGSTATATGLLTPYIIDSTPSRGVAERKLPVSAMIQQYRYDDLMRDYNKLDQRLNTQELRSDIAAATANVVRYPNGFVYNAGPSPFCTCGNNWGGCCAA